MHQVETRVQVQRSEDLRRLALKAERVGVRVLRIDGTDQHIATSGTRPVCYEVSVRGCSCRGWQTWHRCQHWALYLAECGMLPDLEPDVLLDERHSPRCGTCKGEGFVRAYVGGGLADWVASPCTGCGQHAA